MKQLGELEAKIMAVLWRQRSASTVREVLGRLADQRPLAYTTVMTVMDRLTRKGLLRRRNRGRAFEYEPAVSEGQYTASLMHELLARSADRTAALAHFVAGMRKRDEGELLRLASEAARRRAGR